MQKRIAILYDFDYTLSHGYMQQFGLMQDSGFSDVYEFFRECDVCSNEKNMDMCLSSMCGIVEMARRNGKEVTKEYLSQFGKNIEYYDGVDEWFEKINAIGEVYGYQIEHYIISSGIKEIIEGTTIAKYFKRIYANFYAYKNGVAFWPAQVVNYTSKTQYIFRVRKNTLDDLSSLQAINAKMNDDEVLPFENIIYLGDSETDIPSFKVVKNSGGMAVCVYEGGNESAKEVARKCMLEGRCNYFAEADYRESSDLYGVISNYITNICKKNKNK